MKSIDQNWFMSAGTASGSGWRLGSPFLLFTPQHREHLAETVGRVPFDHRLDSLDDRIVPPLVGPIVVHRSADADDLAGTTLAQAIRITGMID